MIAEQIKAYVDNMGFKQTAIASKSGIRVDSLNKTLKGKRTMTAEEYVRICDSLNVPYDKFSDGAYETKSKK